MNCLTVELGGARIKLALVVKGEVMRPRTIPAFADEGLARRLPAIEQEIEALMAEAGLAPDECSALGFVFPCLVDGDAGRVLSVPRGRFEDAMDLDLSAWARSRWGLPLTLEMDSNAALLGEWRHGAGRGADSIVQMTFGTGIGTAVLLQGRLLRGRHRQAGNFGGHMIVNPRGRRCVCPGRGCLETEASTWALPEVLRTEPDAASSRLRREPVLDYEAVFRLAREDDAVARRIRDRSLDLWGGAVVSLINLFDPERVIVGGGIMRGAEEILPALQEAANSAWTPAGAVDVVVASQPDWAGLLGVAWLAEHTVESI